MLYTYTNTYIRARIILNIPGSGPDARMAAIVKRGQIYQSRVRTDLSTERHLHVEPIGSSNSTVPQARILYRALLVAKVRIDQPIALGITLRPLEVGRDAPHLHPRAPEPDHVLQGESLLLVDYQFLIGLEGNLDQEVRAACPARRF